MVEKNKIEKRIRKCWGEGVEIVNKMVWNNLPENVLLVTRSSGGKNIPGTGNTG